MPSDSYSPAAFCSKWRSIMSASVSMSGDRSDGSSLGSSPNKSMLMCASERIVLFIFVELALYKRVSIDRTTCFWSPS